MANHLLKGISKATDSLSKNKLVILTHQEYGQDVEQLQTFVISTLTSLCIEHRIREVEGGCIIAIAQ